MTAMQIPLLTCDLWEHAYPAPCVCGHNREDAGAVRAHPAAGFGPLTIMGRGEPPPTMKGRLAPDRSLTPTLFYKGRGRVGAPSARTFIVTSWTNHRRLIFNRLRGNCWRYWLACAPMVVRRLIGDQIPQLLPDGLPPAVRGPVDGRSFSGAAAISVRWLGPSRKQRVWCSPCDRSVRHPWQALP